jgi:hypothetical protein
MRYTYRHDRALGSKSSFKVQIPKRVPNLIGTRGVLPDMKCTDRQNKRQLRRCAWHLSRSRAERVRRKVSLLTAKRAWHTGVEPNVSTCQLIAQFNSVFKQLAFRRKEVRWSGVPPRKTSIKQTDGVFVTSKLSAINIFHC